MTFDKAIELWEMATRTSTSEFLFDGRENRDAEIEAVYDAFGIVEEDVTCKCDRCLHEDRCPFSADESEGTVIVECNFYEVSR